MSGAPGRKVIKPCSVHYSNVMLVDPTTGYVFMFILYRVGIYFSFSEPTKTSRRFLEDGTKVRVSKKTGSIIPKPDPLFDRSPRSIGKSFTNFDTLYLSNISF